MPESASVTTRDAESSVPRRLTKDQLQEIHHRERWFQLRLTMGYSSIVLLVAIMLFATYVLVRSQDFPSFVVKIAAAALFADILGLFTCIWKIVLSNDDRKK